VKLPSKSWPLRRLVASTIFALWITHADHAVAAVPVEAAQQLLEHTTFMNVLRTEAEQASLLADQLSEDLPPDLRSDLRRVFDRDLGYEPMEVAVVKEVAAKLAQSRFDSALRWWASDSGQAIRLSESRAYASLLPGSSFQAFNPTQAAPDEGNSARALRVLARGRFSGFAVSLISSNAGARVCLSGTMDRLQTCMQRPAFDVPPEGDVAQFVENTVREQYLRESAGDLDAYLAYLSSSEQESAIALIRDSTAGVVSRSWQRALKDAIGGIDQYARVIAGTSRQPTLQQTIADIDGGRNLGRANFVLQLMQRQGPADAEVLVQLARITIKRAHDLTSNDVAPSVPQIDPTSLQAAEQLLEQARKLDPNRGEAWMLLGQVAYLKRNFPQALELLNEAKAVGTNSPWLDVNLGDVLWAMAYPPPVFRRELAQQAAAEFEAALAGKAPGPAEERAVHQLGPVYAELGEISKADVYYRRYVSYKEGLNKAYALHRYAHFLLFYAKDVDASVAAARQAVQTASFPLGRAFLAQILTIKAGTLEAAGRGQDAPPYIAEARAIQPDLESLSPDLARLSAMFPGVVGIHAAGLTKNFSGTLGGRTLVYASLYTTGEQMEELLSWGANPNYFDPEEGTALHFAILADNVAAVRVLLAHGANPMTPFVDGRVPSQLTSDPSDTKRGEILALIAKAVGGTNSVPLGTPLRPGYDYEVKKTIDHGAWGNALTMGDRITFVSNECRYTDPSLACLVVKKANGQSMDVAMGKDQLVKWEDWFRELGPSKQN
jgi:tetratricopeptide (TPR) repeat protein